MRARWRAAGTSARADLRRMRTMSAASIATSVPELRAMPSVAAASAGESLIPSPTCNQKDTKGRYHGDNVTVLLHLLDECCLSLR